MARGILKLALSRPLAGQRQRLLVGKRTCAGGPRMSPSDPKRTLKGWQRSYGDLDARAIPWSALSRAVGYGGEHSNERLSLCSNLLLKHQKMQNR
jgi:hypothetical protein